MYTITNEDLTKAQEKLALSNGDKPGEQLQLNSPLGATLAELANTEYVDKMATMTMFGVAMRGRPDPIYASLAAAIMLGFQAGLTRAVDEPVRALQESISAPSAQA